MDIIIVIRDWLRDLGPWAEAAQSLFTLLGLIFTVIVIPLVQWIRRLRRTLTIRAKELEVADSDYGTAPAQAPAAGASFENWETIRKKWREARERTEELIQGLHGNMRRAFDAEDRFSYDRIARMLHDRGKLTELQSDALRRLDQLALSRRKSRAATAEELQRANGYFTTLDTALPAKAVDGE